MENVKNSKSDIIRTNLEGQVGTFSWKASYISLSSLIFILYCKFLYDVLAVSRG